MDDLVSIIRRYQDFDQRTGEFSLRRTNIEYAALLGVHGSYLTRFYEGRFDSPWKVVRGLVRAFPESTAEVVAFLRSDLPVSRKNCPLEAA